MTRKGEVIKDSPLSSSSEHDSADTGDNIPPMIAKLHQDVLWKIFMTNADMNNDKPGRDSGFNNQVRDWTNRPLVVTWTCSHVCRRWRELILDSPSLWGRLIDLDVLATVQPRWQNEVLRRTGQSTLDVKGSVFASTPLEKNLFTYILKDYWPRIQCIEVEISPVQAIPHDTWELLYRPAPALQIFRLESEAVDRTIHSLLTVGLFANDAPLIQVFASGMFDLRLTPAIRWLSQIRRLDGRLPKSKAIMSTDDWVRALERMPHIESLTLKLAFALSPGDPSTSTELHLPDLDEIRLTDNVIVCTAFLAQIIPRIGCSLSLTCHEPFTGTFQAIGTTSAIQVLSRYCQNYFNLRKGPNLFLAIHRDGFSIREEHYHGSNRDTKFFDIAVRRSDEPSQISDTLSVLDAFSSCNFSSITILTFRFWIYPPQALYPNLRSFLALLPNVKTLITSFDALHAFQLVNNHMLNAEHQNNRLHRHRLLFPLLRSVKVEDFGSDDPPQNAIPFLTSRIESQAPLEVLDLTPFKSFQSPNIFHCITGLKVIYNDGTCVREHICGTNSDDGESTQ